jgi:F420-dependent oxidoreductase-like protein
MTALTMAAISGGRFILGLGVSGPQVVEGLQGIPFAAPLTRLRETIEIIRIAIAGDKVRYEGRFHQLPRPGGQGKALRLAQPANPDIPIALATIGPRSLELTGEIADGWVGTCFSPETADAYWEPIRRGAAKAGRNLDGFLFRAGGAIGISDDVEGLIERCRPGLAFTLGAMGSPRTNFYNEAYRRIGFEDAAVRVQRLWLDGRRDDAVAAVPDAMVLATNLLGTEAMVRERIRMYRDAGVTMLSLTPMGRGMAEKLDVLGRAVELVAQEAGGPNASPDSA